MNDTWFTACKVMAVNLSLSPALDIVHRTDCSPILPIPPSMFILRIVWKTLNLIASILFLCVTHTTEQKNKRRASPEGRKRTSVKRPRNTNGSSSSSPRSKGKKVSRDMDQDFRHPM